MKSTVVTWGVFDGVHIGHKKIIRQTVKWAKKLGILSVVVTFDNHPEKVLYNRDIKTLLSLEERKRLIYACGVDRVVVLKFTKRFSKTTAEEFVRAIVRKFEAKVIVSGFDTMFGKDREGTFETLQKLSKLYDYRIVRVTPAKYGNAIVSSSFIREKTENGELAIVEKLLGRKIMVIGRVVKGESRGAEIGFPTANLRLAGGIKPSRGVYGSKVQINGKVYDGVANIGVRPTFNGNKREVVEVHILNFNERDIYNKDVKLEFLFRIRDEKRFSGAEELKRQIGKDISYYFSRVRN